MLLPYYFVADFESYLEEITISKGKGQKIVHFVFVHKQGAVPVSIRRGGVLAFLMPMAEMRRGIKEQSPDVP